jgi:hypothetical protein
MCSSRFLAAFSCGLALAFGSARVTAQGNACSLPPAEPFNPYLLNYDRQHTYNPYSSKDNEVANVNHEPKAPGEKGHWISKSYKVGCGADSGLFKETYLSAAVGSQTEGGVCSGTYLHIANLSPKYPAYFGVDGLLNDHLEPKQRKVIHLPRYAPGTGSKPAVVANVYVKYWDDEGAPQASASGKTCSTMAEFFQTVATPNSFDYAKNRHMLSLLPATPTLHGSLNVLTPRYGHIVIIHANTSRFYNDTTKVLFIEACIDGGDDCIGLVLKPNDYEDFNPGNSFISMDDLNFRVWMG